MSLATLAHQIELIPTAEHVEYFRKACGVARFAYNWGLAEWNRQYIAGNKPNWMALKKQLNAIKEKEFPWMYEVTKCAPEGALANLGTAWSNYFKDLKKKGRKAQKPQFKKKGKSRDRFYLSNDQFSVQGKEATLPHLGPVKLREALRFAGKTLGASVCRIADRWFISIQVEANVAHLKQNNSKAVGVDLGIESDLTLSTGKKYHGPKALKLSLEKLKLLNRRLHRKVKGSQNREKAALKVARLHRRVANLRKDFIHKVTTQVTKKYGVICLETLNISGMLKNHKLARAIADVSWNEVKRQFEYKAQLREGRVLFLDPFYPSSKVCRKCGTKNGDLTLKERSFRCVNPNCAHTEDRDIHAARNILKQGTLGRRETQNACGHPASTTKKPRKRFLGRKPGGLKQEKCINLKTQSNEIKHI